MPGGRVCSRRRGGQPPAGACRGEEMGGEARSIRSNLAFPRAINSDVNWQVR